MTLQDYLREHARREGDEQIAYCCEYCGEEIEPGWPGFRGNGENRGVFLHKECVMEWVVREYDEERLALDLGFDKIQEAIL